MKTIQWKLFRYTLPLKEPLIILDHELNERKGLILRLYGESSEDPSFSEFGEGEIVTLPGMHLESQSHAEAQIREYLSSRNSSQYKSFRDLFASVRFGLDMAQRTMFLNLKNYSDNHNVEENVDTYNRFVEKRIGCSKIPVNGLAIGSGKKLELECKRFLNEGFKAVKIKVGRHKVKEDFERVKLARKILDEKVSLRLDANRLWEWDEALEFCNLIKEYDIEYCEEPLRDLKNIEKLHEQTGIPLALDETLWKNPNPEKIPKNGVRALVLKPCILGGWDNTKLWVDFAENEGIKVVLSSSFESGLGLNWIAFIAANLLKDQLPIGIDTAKCFKNDIINTPFFLNKGYYVFPKSWPKANIENLQFVDEGSWRKQGKKLCLW